MFIQQLYSPRRTEDISERAIMQFHFRQKRKFMLFDILDFHIAWDLYRSIQEKKKIMEQLVEEDYTFKEIFSESSILVFKNCKNPLLPVTNITSFGSPVLTSFLSGVA